MIEQGVHRYTVIDNMSGEKLNILRPVPDSKTCWGVFECIRETEVGSLIPVVTGEVMSHALHGYFLPLRRSIGLDPRHILRKLPSDMICGLINSCILARPEICRPHKKMPHCYVPPGMTGLRAEATATVIRAWVDGRYVVVVKGAEFSY